MTVYNDRSTTVSDGAVMVNGQRYNIADVATVSMIRPILSKTLGWGVAVLGLIILVAGYIIWRTLLTPVVAGAAILIAGVVIALVVRESYTVRMTMKSGSPVMLQFANPTEAQHTVTAIGAALDQQRAADERPLEREVSR